jgi:2-polyprenyl-3-methyl-5-hydroxy-6-metoxy-1,4-benzoquinol methylase
MKFRESRHPLGFIEAIPKPAANDLAEYYRDKYFQEGKSTYSSSYPDTELAYFQNMARVADRTCERVTLSPRTLLDLGCGEGYFSRAFRSLGWVVTCADYSDFGVRQHNPELLPALEIGDASDVIERMAAAGRSFGLVNLQNVLEHVRDPLSLLLAIKRLITARSIVRIKVPNDYSAFQAELVANGHTTNTWFAPPEHLSYFNRTALLEVFQASGYRLLSLQADFPIEIFLANPHSNYWRDRSLGKAAHQARVFVENFLMAADLDAYIRYTEAAADLEFGRDLVAYVRLVE